ncbi:MAG: hypothetical protein CMJ58_25505 [Planctomycetaceae bacterium]|nr:hypothetical protein [Planctomycetaceae bacterium]
MTDDPLRIRVSEEPRRGAHRRQQPDSRSRRSIPMVAVLTAASVIAVVVFLATRPSAPPESQPSDQGVAIANGPSGDDLFGEEVAKSAAAGQGDLDNSPPAEVVVRDDGRLLWQAPTAGPPISLAGVPAGTQVLVHLRPAMIAAHPEGAKLLAALGPWGEHAKSRAESILGRPLESIDQLLISVTTAADDRLLLALRARLPDSESMPVPETEVAGYDAFFIGAEGEGGATGRTLVACPRELAPELREQSAPPPLATDLEHLVATSDADRAVTVILQPRFLQASGGKLLTADARPLRAALRWLTDDRATALALGMHWDDDFFVELRATPVQNSPPQRYAVELDRQLAAAANPIEELIAATPWHPHGRKVLFRLPAMLRALARYVRYGVDDGQTVLRCYLPAAAGHNLILASELLLTLPRTEAALAGATGGATRDGDSAGATIEQRLAATTSLSFGKETLQRSLEVLADDMGVPIEIAGGDLQVDGITKNQSFAIDLHDRPAAEILLEILLLANPDRGAKGPSDPKQKLVYVIRPATDGQPARIVVTTRAAAAGRGEKLPDVFGD